MRDVKFEDRLREVGRESFKKVTTSFGGERNHKAESCRNMVADLVHSCKVTDCYTSLKVHFLDSHLDFLQKILGL